MNHAEVIKAFLDTRPRKRIPEKSWKDNNLDKYKVALELYGRGYCVPDIARHLGCTYDTLRKTFIRDKVFTPKEYRKGHSL